MYSYSHIFADVLHTLRRSVTTFNIAMFFFKTWMFSKTTTPDSNDKKQHDVFLMTVRTMMIDMIVMQVGKVLNIKNYWGQHQLQGEETSCPNGMTPAFLQLFWARLQKNTAFQKSADIDVLYTGVSTFSS